MPSDDESLENRNKFSRPIYEEFLAWYEKTSQKIITNEKLKEALTYIKNQYVELGQFLNDGWIPLTTNLVERSIRPFAVHRRAWLFADTPAGAVCNAVMYSLVESAGINKYVEYLLTELPQLEKSDWWREAETISALVRASSWPCEGICFGSVQRLPLKRQMKCLLVLHPCPRWQINNRIAFAPLYQNLAALLIRSFFQRLPTIGIGKDKWNVPLSVIPCWTVPFEQNEVAQFVQPHL